MKEIWFLTLATCVPFSFLMRFVVASAILLSALIPVTQAIFKSQEKTAVPRDRRRIMIRAGFMQLPIEWWHYDALPKAEVRKKFKMIE